MRASSGQPAVVNNDWTVLEAAQLGRWSPQRSVSIVIPAHQPRHLPHVLAALAAQTYPGHLLEVVVADDGSRPPIDLPEIRPERTRVVTVDDGWGRAAACHAGAQASEGEVIHWLDADMVCARDQVEAQLRWHHVIDYAVVLGHKLFTADDALAGIAPATLAETVSSGEDPWAHASASAAPHAWVETILEETRDLTLAGARAMRAHVGASASVSRDLYAASGGMPADLVLGEDIVLGYRLRETGAVFIPDRAARSLHLGETSVMRDQDAVNRYNRPFITDLVPEFRGHRLRVPRSYTVPYVEVVVPVTGVAHEEVAACVHAQLAGSVPDVVVTLVADWSALPTGRRGVLHEESLDLRLTERKFRADPRIRLVEQEASVSDATFRLTLPGPDGFPAERSLESLVRRMEDEHLGLIEIAHGDVGTARLERTASVARARRLGGDVQDTIRRICGVLKVSGGDVGFVTPGTMPRIKQVRGLVPWGV